MHSVVPRSMRSAGAAGILFAATLLSGCSTELASFDDTYVPASVQENFPIKVVERPVRLTLEASPGGLQSDDVSEVIRFGREAAATAITPVTIVYSESSRSGRDAAKEAVAILARQGVPSGSIRLSRSAGANRVVTLAFTSKEAQTKPCGEWKENLRPNQFNDSGTAFGCSVQQNMAAMVSNPGDFEASRPMPPVRSSSQNPALTRYNNGAWTTPTSDSSF